MKSLKLGDIEIFWLNGGEFELDGGTMFGLVPKVLWSKKFPVVDEEDSARLGKNYIKLLNFPLLIKTPGCLVLVETCLGNKLSEKQKKIPVTRDWEIPQDLKELGFKRQDIDYVILTHCDFDHAGGIVMRIVAGGEELAFPHARHIIQKLEWEDAMHPHIRSEDTYWPENFSKLKDSDNLQLIEGNFTVCNGVEVQHNSGHTRGIRLSRFGPAKKLPTTVQICCRPMRISTLSGSWPMIISPWMPFH